MALEARLSQKLSQNLQLTPQLQQAIKLLQLGRLEFLEELVKEVEQNPLLEFEGEEDASNKPEVKVTESEAAQGENDSSAGAGDSAEEFNALAEMYIEERGSSVARDTDELSPIESRVSRPETLQEHLIEQLKLSEIDNKQKLIVSFLIGNLNADGRLTLTNEELSQIGNFPEAQVQAAVELLHTFDPAGVGARSLQECLLLQLKERGQDELLAGKLVKFHLNLLEKRKIDEIAKIEVVSREKVLQALLLLKSLDPYPGRAYSEEGTSFVVPDIYIQRVGEDYKISLNEDGIPKLRMSPQYLEMLKASESQKGDQKIFLQDKLKSASWLLKSIHQRNQTILKVAECIARVQREFLDRGAAHLKPLTLQNVADEVGLHESTISRVTTNKFAHTPQGVFELKYFFINALASVSGSVSTVSVKERIKILVSKEDPTHPISDQEIVEQLKREQVTIARRTVAKYREELGILSSSARKKGF